MIELLQTTEKSNKILLGEMYDGRIVYMKYPEFRGRPMSDIILIVGVTGSGKSVLKKLIASQMAMKRPVYMLDPPGRDDFYCNYPNYSKNLPPNMGSQGLNGLYFYYPNPNARKKRQFEILRRPNLRKYTLKELNYLNITQTGAIFLRNLMEKYPKIKSFDFLIKKVEEHSRSLPPLSARSLLNVLPYIASTGNFRLDNKQDINLKACFDSGHNMVFCYNNITTAKLEINYLFNQLIKYRDLNPGGHRPFIFIDEAHLIFGGAKEDDMSNKIEQFVLTCRKLSIGMCLVLPEIESIRGYVLSDIKTMIFGKYKGAKDKLYMMFGKENAQTIRQLKLNRFPPFERQFAYYSQDFESFFIMDRVYEPPCGIHRE